MKKVFYWVFNDNLIFPKFNKPYEDINHEAEEVLNNGWNPSYLFGDNSHKNFFYLFREPLEVDSFEFLNSLEFVYWGDSPYYHKIQRKFIFRFSYKCEEIHVWLKTIRMD